MTQKYDFTSSGIKVKGEYSYHVFKLEEQDQWVLIRYRDNITYEAGTFASPDEARAFAHALGLELTKVKQ